MYFSSTFLLLPKAPLDCPLKCTPNKSNSSDPICASNGIAYESMCEMLKSNCRFESIALNSNIPRAIS